MKIRLYEWVLRCELLGGRVRDVDTLVVQNGAVEPALRVIVGLRVGDGTNPYGTA